MRLGNAGKLQNLKARVATQKPPKERLEQLIGVLMGTDFGLPNGQPNDHPICGAFVFLLRKRSSPHWVSDRFDRPNDHPNGRHR
jgi:hypothetical protein